MRSLQKIIHFRKKKDDVIKLWYTKAQENYSKAVIGTLIIHAIEHYIKNHDYLTIGTVNINSKLNYANNMYVQLYCTEDQIVYKWIKEKKIQNMNSSEEIRKILQNSIRLVKTQEEEVFPSVLEIEAEMQEKAASSTNHTEESFVQENIIMTQSAPRQQTKVFSEEMPLKRSSNTQDQTDRIKNKPACYGLFSKDD